MNISFSYQEKTQSLHCSDYISQRAPLNGGTVIATL